MAPLVDSSNFTMTIPHFWCHFTEEDLLNSVCWILILLMINKGRRDSGWSQPMNVYSKNANKLINQALKSSSCGKSMVCSLTQKCFVLLVCHFIFIPACFFRFYRWLTIDCYCCLLMKVTFCCTITKLYNWIISEMECKNTKIRKMHYIKNYEILLYNVIWQTSDTLKHSQKYINWGLKFSSCLQFKYKLNNTTQLHYIFNGIIIMLCYCFFDSL